MPVSDEPLFQVAHGCSRASIGRWDEADAALRHAHNLPGSDVARWIPAGSWKVEDYRISAEMARNDKSTVAEAHILRRYTRGFLKSRVTPRTRPKNKDLFPRTDFTHIDDPKVTL